MNTSKQKYNVQTQRFVSCTTTGTVLASTEAEARQLASIDDMTDQVIDVQHSKEVSVELIEGSNG